MEKERKELQDNLLITGGKFAMFINASNLMFQIRTFISPTSTRHLIVNTLYTINTIISCSLYWAGYRYKKLHCILPAYAMPALRSALRMIDIEDSAPHMDTV